MILPQMGFSEGAIELAMRMTPRVEEAAQWLLDQAASSTAFQAGGTELQEAEDDDDLFPRCELAGHC